MTNDDRSNDDRTGDGQAPRWGEAPQHPAAGGEPRYGERVDPAAGSTPQYGSTEHGSTEYGQPRYGEQADGQQQYGEQAGGQQQYGSGSWNDQQQAHQPYAASSAPASAGAPAWQSYDEQPAKKKRTVGVVALVLGIVALALGIAAGYFFGTAIADSNLLRDAMQNGGSTGAVDPSDAEAFGRSPEIITFGVLALVGTVVGIWAIIQGIVAIATKRGRAFGVFGLILAVLGPVALVVLYAAIAGAAAMGSVGTAP